MPIASLTRPSATHPSATHPSATKTANDAFLSLFPHRFDYIWAPLPAPGERVQWQTESRYPLSDRHIRQGSDLYGVRFGKETQYCMLDIDTGSLLHPGRDRLALGRIFAALEPLGLVAPLICTSSYSGGLHVYFPISDQQKSWALALVVSTVLAQAGFKLTPGQLELFPNPKPYMPQADGEAGKFSLFNAHRLPLQMGSYLLNADLEPIWSSEAGFVQQWQWARAQNELDQRLFQQLLQQNKSRQQRVTGKADKFLADLNHEIALGWTGAGQTNYLLGRITLRTYVFHHVLNGGEPLTGPALVAEVVAIAQSLPGYHEWCHHQHEIVARAEEWATCIQTSRYFPYGTAQGKFKAVEKIEAKVTAAKPTWNQVQSLAARDRICQALARLLDSNSLPAAATARFQALTRCGIGGASLYRHRDLWHPKYLGENQLSSSVSSNVSSNELTFNPLTSGENSMSDESLSDKSLATALTALTSENLTSEKDTLNPQAGGDSAVGASPPPCWTSLLSQAGSNALTGLDLDDHQQVLGAIAGSNSTLTQESRLDRESRLDNVPAQSLEQTDGPSIDPSIVAISAKAENTDWPAAGIAPVMAQVKMWLATQQTAAKAALSEYSDRQAARQAAQHQAAQQERRQRMQQYLASGDPILVAEARAWMAQMSA